MPQSTQEAMHRKRQEVLEEELRAKARELKEHMKARSFLLVLTPAVGRDGMEFIMAGPAPELQQLAARNLR